MTLIPRDADFREGLVLVFVATGVNAGGMNKET
jgi:hypothetical protein